MSHQPNERYSQPGLELAPSMDPEVVHTPPSDPIPVSHPVILPYKADGPSPYSDASHSAASSPYDAYGGYGAYGAYAPEPVEPPSPAKSNSKKKLFILIGVLVAVAVIVGATVGGVLGGKSSSDGSKSKDSSSPSESTTSPSPDSSDSPPKNTTALLANTRLSVTGRRLDGDGFISRLFWQGGDNKIRTSSYSSAGAKWSKPLVFDDTDDAKPGTPIAATIYLRFPQYELFYLDGSSTFRGVNFGEDETVPKIDSVNTDRPAFKLEDSSKMTAYWPYVIYQNENSSFHREVFDSHGRRNWVNDTMQGWFNPDVVPLGDKGTGMAVVPVVKEFKGPYAAGLAYRDQDGRLAIFSFGGDDTGISWDNAAPDMSIPAGTSIGALAVGRPNTNSTNTWILYQDDDHKVQTVWQEDDNGWKGPQEVGEADPGTDIACLTEVTGDEPSQVFLSEQLEMRRCYYSLRGEIKEMRLTSSGWVEGEAIPME
ncbi:hypothetical protein GGR52DRAFT_298939 [Hypoxylon sp. FL1284]|nr:hypothetical protein GGR52DRAFT_298939 [Hypoxylon sp. FL1284]